jgi:2'-5' RNA ligase
MRVFVAIDLPGDIREAVANLQHELRSIAHKPRWVAPESIHVTLKFLGEVPEHRIDELDGALSPISWKPFLITVSGVGFFPSARSPRVFWAGMRAPTMADLAMEIDLRLQKLGFEKESRAFRPHITLARAKETRIDASLVSAASRFENHEFGAFTVDRFFLFQSTLKPAGAIYTKLKEYMLERR